MKILKMLGLVVALHAVVLVFGFVLPGCQSTARTSPSAPGRPADSGLSRIDAARAAGPGQLAGTHTAPPAPAATRAQPPAGPAFAGGPVTDFSAPVAVAPSRPHNTAEASALPAAESEEPPAMLTYTVAAGDSLWTIAKKFKIRNSDLIAVNTLPASLSLQVGQKLKIPAPATPAGPAATAASKPGTTTYKVQSNDSLSTIARRHNTTVAQIQTLNKLNGILLRIGQELLVPVIADASGAPSQTPDDAAKSVAITHIVRPNENLDGIARHYGATVTEIGVANHITDPRRLKAGQKLTINARKNIPLETTPAIPDATPASVTIGMEQPGQTPPPALPDDNPPLNPFSPVFESPVAPAPGTPLGNPPVNTPQDPVNSPIGIPQN